MEDSALVLRLYLLTAFICLLIGGTYQMLEEFYEDVDLTSYSLIERENYIQYQSDDFSINPFDSYYSKIELYLIYMCWVIGVWNLTDAVIYLHKAKLIK